MWFDRNNAQERDESNGNIEMNKIGFGFLRLPHIGDDEKNIDWELLHQMTDAFLAAGGTYFDTAYTYLDGKSEEAIRKSVTERHARDRFVLADKLPSWHVKSQEDCRNYFEEQLERCGVDYFDVYLLHWLNRENYEIVERYREFEFLQEMKAAGKVKRIGFSYHDGPELLEEILAAHPETEIVQLQINYLDWKSVGIEGKKCYETAVKHGKSIVVMEPVKGGILADVPDEANQLFQSIRPDDSPASWALDFAQSLEGVDLVLSGMNSLRQIHENMRPARRFTDREYETVQRAAELIAGKISIPCTACRYCAASCPQNIAIPDYFGLLNEYKRFPDEGWKIEPVYEAMAKSRGKASSCVRCGNCEKNCPQRIPIIDSLKKVAEIFETE